MGSSEKVPNGCLTTASAGDDAPFDLLRDFYGKHYDLLIALVLI